MSDVIRNARDDFAQLKATVHGKPFVYLDSGATTLKPACVARAVAMHYDTEVSNVHRGVHYFSELSTSRFEAVRAKVAALINASSEKEVIFTSGTTAGINTIAYSFGQGFLKPGDEIIITEMEHHSNIVPWQLACERYGCVLKVAPINDHGEIILDKMFAMMNERTKLVSVVYVSNSLGTINPVAQIVEKAHAVGAKVLIDAAQAVAHLEIDVQTLDCDFLVFSSHKLFGPSGVGVLWGKQALLEAMPPFFGGGDMIKSVRFTGTTFADLPYKFEAGTPNIAGVIGLGAAIDWLRQFSYSDIQAYEHALLQYAQTEVAKIPGLRLIGTAKNKASIVSFVLEDIHPHDIGSIVDAEGVAIRTGHHCCQPVMERFGVPATARASLSLYNNEADVAALVHALRKVQEVFA